MIHMCPFEEDTYYSRNKERILAKTRQKHKCECGAEYSYSNRKCHLGSIRHIIYLKSKESNERLQHSTSHI